MLAAEVIYSKGNSLYPGDNTHLVLHSGMDMPVHYSDLM